jgi:hypothetical protein
VAWFRETAAGAAVLVACAALLAAPVTTPAAGPPIFGASWVTAVTATGARLHAELDVNGLATKYRFEYITDAAYKANPPGERFLGATQTKEDSGGEPLALLQLLPSATAFHYRPLATNSAGSATGPEHVFVTEESGKVFQLPDDRAWEMVSPADKVGGAIAAPEELFGGGDLQAASATATVTYGSGTSFGDAAGAPPSSQYLSRRTASAWVTENISTPLESGAYGDQPDGAPYRLFSADLARAVLFGGLACRGGLEACPAPNPPLAESGAPNGYMAYYLRDNDSGSLSSLLGAADVAHSSVSPSAFEFGFAAAAPDLSHLVLSSCAALTVDASEVPAGAGKCDESAQNLYDRSATGLKAINLKPGDFTTTPGAAVASPVGAVSQDGSRVYWSDGSNLYLRESGQSHLLGESAGATFETATPDGAFAFFTKAGDLYRFAAVPPTTTKLTPAGGVVGVLGASADGNSVYFQDATGLELWHAGLTTTVAEGVDAATASNYPPSTGAARVSSDGLHLAFLSKAELTGFDNLDADTKQPVEELYVYGSAAGGGAPSLTCASCNPTGERPTGPASVPGVLRNGSTHAYRPRVLSADGLRLFFETEDGIWEKDTNKAPDVYEWEAAGAGGCTRPFGCVAPISIGKLGASLIDASADGTDVYFLTVNSLVTADPEGSADLYDARVGGGFSTVDTEIICVGDNCQSLPGEPEDPTPGTLFPKAGNPPLRILGPKKRSKPRRRHHRRHGRHRDQQRRTHATRRRR